MVLSLKRRESMEENEVKNVEGENKEESEAKNVEGESKSDKFKRLATKRVKNAISKVELITNDSFATLLPSGSRKSRVSAGKGVFSFLPIGLTEQNAGRRVTIFN